MRNLVLLLALVAFQHHVLAANPCASLPDQCSGTVDCKTKRDAKAACFKDQSEQKTKSQDPNLKGRTSDGQPRGMEATGTYRQR
ncbi:hypothetical protein SRS16CHR_03605 [Variovorax sp. SRS16]|uniref:hypothetical protein n=1 Tax=Variovorax sp. SRS16 TaxID=282217 RepID=UPI001318E749|nr:hypothetical protein [Variovorax sp. SRS16]VTU25164.1 hypothetical protein SRS16CHR_03605 [Variovorax sp. SRS16]